MVDFLHGLALRLRPLRPVFLALAVLGLLTMAASLLLGAGRGDVTLRLAIVASLWGGLLFAFVDLFRQVPRLPDAGDRLFKRLRLQCRRLFFLLLALVVAFTTLLLLSMSWRLATVS